jgi:EAL and modified HD-GYP domain-containing signal transduction protein
MFWSKRNKLPPNAPKVPEDPAEPPLTSVATPQTNRVLYSARQPILDRDDIVFGYELLFRSGPENRYTATDPDRASAASLEQSASAFGLDRLVGDRRAFVNLSRGALLAEYHLLLPRERIVVELLENIEPDDEVMAACRRLKASGYLLALDDYAGESRSEPFLGLVDFVKVDLRQWSRALDPRAVASLRRPGLRLLAEKVETHAEQQAALDAGYDLLQGYYYCKPQMVEVHDLPPSKLSVLRFLAETNSAHTSFGRLEELFRADVGLTVRLLRYLNSAAFGWRHEIDSIQHALELMGERPLRRWASMLALMSLCDDRPHELLVTALSRARFAERISVPSGLPEHEHELFLAGMLSLVDAMVGRPATEVLAGLAVPESVRAAVLDHGLPLGRALGLVTAYQQGDWQRVDESRRDCLITDCQLDEAYVDSLAWAEATAI